MKKINLCLCLLVLPIVLNAQWLWQKEKMEHIKAEKNTPLYVDAYNKLIEEAQKELNSRTVSVMDKKTTLGSEDKHDYTSLSRYWWADTTKPDGLPYVNRDGRSNPELNQYDRNRLGHMASAVNTLSLAYFYTDDEKYAAKAVEFLRTWFLNPETKMNPNLNYSQVIPGRYNSQGRPEGLIDTYSFVDMLNSVQLLNKSVNYTNADKEGLKQWFAELIEWMQTSPQGKTEDNAKNNHSVAYDVQLLTYALFADKMELAKKIINDFPQKRMFAQIEPDGSQPNELWRTLSFGYSEYNLRHMIDLFAMAKSIGINLYNMESPDGRSFYKATDYLTKYLGKDVSEWPHKQISQWYEKQQDLCEDLYRIVDLDSTKKEYLDLYNKYFSQAKMDRNRLLFGAEK